MMGIKRRPLKEEIKEFMIRNKGIYDRNKGRRSNIAFSFKILSPNLLTM